MTTSELDGLRAATTERAFRRADRLPPDAEVLRILEDTRPELLGEGYHVVTLCEPAHRFVVKYGKSSVSIPPLAPRSARSDPRLRATDHGVGEDGRLHDAIWQHIRGLRVVRAADGAQPGLLRGRRPTLNDCPETPGRLGFLISSSDTSLLRPTMLGRLGLSISTRPVTERYRATVAQGMEPLPDRGELEGVGPA